MVLSGAVEITSHANGEDHLITRHEAGRFIGELNLVTGLRVFVSARMAESGEVLVLSQDALRNLIATQPGLSDVILKALMARCMLLSSAAESLRLIGACATRPRHAAPANTWTRSRAVEWLDPRPGPGH